MSENNITIHPYGNGAGVGGFAAALLSYLKWHSIGYAILHFFCGWFYVAYHLITYGWPK